MELLTVYHLAPLFEFEVGHRYWIDAPNYSYEGVYAGKHTAHGIERESFKCVRAYKRKDNGIYQHVEDINHLTLTPQGVLNARRLS